MTTEEIEFNLEELRMLTDILQHALDDTVTMKHYGEIADIRKKVDEAKGSAYKRKRAEERNHDCEEDGHNWGETKARPEHNHLFRGCNYCPAVQSREDFVCSWDDWESYDEYERVML